MATDSFMANNRRRGTGAANKYRRLAHEASLATVSPAKRAKTVVSKNPLAKKIITTVKFIAPEVAKSIKFCPP